MKLFTHRRRTKRLDKELGHGLWRQAHDRFVRGLDRFHQILEGVTDDATHNELVLIGDTLADQLPRVYALCKQGHALYPAEDLRVPGGAQGLHSGLSRAANHVATTAEAEAMVRLHHGTIDAVQRRAAQVIECVDAAEEHLTLQRDTPR